MAHFVIHMNSEKKHVAQFILILQIAVCKANNSHPRFGSRPNLLLLWPLEEWSEILI